MIMSKKLVVDVLLVEDNYTDAELTMRALKKNGLTNEVYHVEDGYEAINFVFCENEHEDREWGKKLKFILLDLKLPKMDGLEVLARIKTNPNTEMIPVVMFSSSRELSDIESAYSLGANSYVVKPVNYKDYILAVQHIGLYWFKFNEGF